MTKPHGMARKLKTQLGMQGQETPVPHREEKLAAEHMVARTQHGQELW